MSRKQTQSDLEARKMHVLATATQIFQRYGYARTTMAELAGAADLSRPSLYELFASKEDLFAAVIQKMSADTLDAFRKEAPRLRTLRAALQHFCSEWATHGIKLAERYPDAKDLFDLSVPAVQRMYEDFVLFLAALVPKLETIRSATKEQILRNLVYSMRGLKDAAQNPAQMERLVRLQVDIFYEALSSGQNNR